MLQPRVWTEAEIVADVGLARAAFRKERLAESLAAWLDEVKRRTDEFDKLFEEHHVDSHRRLTAAGVSEIIEADLLDAFRYLPGPPISADDLKTLADVTSLNPNTLRKRPADAQRVLETILQAVDPSRFPWLARHRDASDDEKRNAGFSSALLLSYQRTLTSRRSDAKDAQESHARKYLVSEGFKPQPIGIVKTFAQFPSRGVVSDGEVQFGPERADLLARIWDDRMLPIECKVSNSSVNSFKRLNHDTLAKLTAWTAAFGANNVVPAALLAGVYSTKNILSAQDAGLAIFWSHRIEDLGEFLERTR